MLKSGLSAGVSEDVVCGDPEGHEGQHEILEDRIQSQIVEVWDCRWPQSVILVFPATEMVHSGERSSVAADGA